MKYRIVWAGLRVFCIDSDFSFPFQDGGATHVKEETFVGWERPIAYVEATEAFDGTTSGFSKSVSDRENWRHDGGKTTRSVYRPDWSKDRGNRRNGRERDQPVKL